MPLPVILGVAAAIAGAAGLGTGIHGAVKMKDANDSMKSAQARNEKNIHRLEAETKNMQTVTDQLGKKELKIVNNFGQFAETMKKVSGRGVQETVIINGVSVSIYQPKDLSEASTGAAVLLGSLGGAALGTAGSFAAAGAVTAAVTAVGTTSAGTAIASLSGAAATNAVLASLGGGAIAAGGGGVALGTTLLGAATAGVGLLIGGIVFSISGSKLSDKADEAWAQVRKTEGQIDSQCAYYAELINACGRYTTALDRVEAAFLENYQLVKRIVDQEGKRDYRDMSYFEKEAVKKAGALTGQLYDMCKVQLVNPPSEKDGVPAVNWTDINKAIEKAEKVCESSPELDVEL